MKIKGEIIFLGLVMSLIGLFCVYKYFSHQVLKTDRVIVLAKVKERTTTKSGFYYSCFFKFRGKEFRVSSPRGEMILKENDLLFVEIYPSDPEINTPLPELSVPKCLSIKDVPIEGWHEVPRDTCRSNY